MGSAQSKTSGEHTEGSSTSAHGSSATKHLKRISRAAFKSSKPGASNGSTKSSRPESVAPSPSAQAQGSSNGNTHGTATTQGTTTSTGATEGGSSSFAQATPKSDAQPPAAALISSIMPPGVTVPCQYRTGKTLGSGTYAIVKEAIHIQTGKYYACKVINKKLMEGREHMVRNEIAVLKRISSGHTNIVTLHDYFETAHNLYLCFDLCTGGELFDRICAKGNYYEADAADLVRTIFKAVKYIHEAGIVHRDLKPENLLFKTPAEDAAIMIADFGLSRVMEDEKITQLTEICGTPGYMAPEIFKRTGHGKPVDVWAMGVITYFLLAGYTPFDRDTQEAEMKAIIAGDYKFEPEEYWQNVSDTAKEFVRTCLTVDPHKRPTAAEALKHKWLASASPIFVTSSNGEPADLLPNVKRAFNAKAAWRKAGFSIRALNRMQTLAHGGISEEAAKLKADVEGYKAESERERMETASITYQPPQSGDSHEDLASRVGEVSLKERS